MKTVYEAANAIEAHLLRDYLQQEGVATLVVGEYLQGAIGDLPAGGFVRLIVDEADHSRARAVIERWESAAVAEATEADDAMDPANDTAPAASAPSKRSTGLLAAALIGLMVGVSGSYIFYRSPASVNGIDHDRDGALDERWIHAPSGALLETHIDRNLDGRVDYIAHFGSHGLIESADADDNFDGKFETRYRYQDSHVESREIDTDGDGILDKRITYSRTGEAVRTDRIQPSQ